MTLSSKFRLSDSAFIAFHYTQEFDLQILLRIDALSQQLLCSMILKLGDSFRQRLDLWARKPFRSSRDRACVEVLTIARHIGVVAECALNHEVLLYDSGL